jgi:hypothetical protein
MPVFLIERSSNGLLDSQQGDGRCCRWVFTAIELA